MGALVALDVLEPAEALLAVAAGERLCLLPAAGVGVGVGGMALAGGVDAWGRHHGGGWCVSQAGLGVMRMMMCGTFVGVVVGGWR